MRAEDQGKIINVQKLEFSHTSFSSLMQKRIHRVMMICSNYDFFMLEEDGRIDEQIFNEYVSLNLRYPPIFIHADSARQAFDIMKNDKIDLVIEMLSTGDLDSFELAKRIKNEYPQVPIVILTHFNRDVSIRLQNEDLTAIDYIFSWLGNADLLVAIIKLIEDKMNVGHDIEKVGVQSILLVEDSVRFTSAYLPNLYKIVLKQAREFMKEALNEHQKMLRMRGRPKILLATNLEEALALYNRYKYNLLGIISDVSYKKNNKRDQVSKEGLQFCRMVKAEDPHMPFLLQSSDISNAELATAMNAGFLHKYSKTLSLELRDYVIRNFAFGDFIFRDPETDEEIARASDLQALQQLILKIPDHILEFHTSHNDISKWLNARALFPIAQMFKFLKISDFPSLDHMRKYIYESISSFRISKGRGVIADFARETFDEYLLFSRIGEGSIGGKARGLAFINSLIKKHRIFNKYKDVIITIPLTVVLGIDIFEEFMETNVLYDIGNSDLSDEEILGHFIRGKLPDRIQEDLHVFISVVKNPIAVRSSSKLEDSFYQPFAGIYSTYMIPNPENQEQKTFTMLTDSIKCVYASVYFRTSKSYIRATSNVLDEEKMGIILQEVCGGQYGDLFYPTLSGVARSINFYPIKPERSEDGIVNVAYGLGKYIVDGGTSIRFSPRYPKKILQLSSAEMALKETQKQFYALTLKPDNFVPSTDDGINILKNRIGSAEDNKSLRAVSSTYDYDSQMVREGTGLSGKKLITFSNILQHETFPLAEIIQELLIIGQKEMNTPIEIEFAAHLDTPPGEPKIFNFLQIRPIVLNEQSISFNIGEVDLKETIVYSHSALGNGIFDTIRDVVYIKPETFDASKNKEIAALVEEINEFFIHEEKNYILIGPGRWGSSDPWLGIPVKWGQISEARIIIESGMENYRIDPSQGTHFFHNLTSFGVGYLTINPYQSNGGFYDIDYLNQTEPVRENHFIRHVRFEKPVIVKIDGKEGEGVIYKPGKGDVV
ncbi:MAG: PEP/pyruvate-binding domain-containing protein [Bacteroidales bacterium]